MNGAIGTTVLLLTLALPATAVALATETFGNAPAVRQPDWAPGVVEVVNLKTRVYGQWVNGNENFFYRGEASDVNEALHAFAAVKSEVRQVILLPGPGSTRSLHGKPVAFDWQLHVPGGIYKAVSRRSHAVMTVYITSTNPRPAARKRVARWLADLDNESFEAREKAQQELKQLGKGAKPHLREALKGASPEARRRLEGLLAHLGGLDVTDLEIPEGVTVVRVDELLALRLKELQDPDQTVCGLAIQDLKALAPYSDKVVPALTDMLGKDRNEWVRRVAAGCLGSLGAQARPALPALERGLADPDPNIQKAFRTAREKIATAKDPPGETERLKALRAIAKDINHYKPSTRGSRP